MSRQPGDPMQPGPGRGLAGEGHEPYHPRPRRRGWRLGLTILAVVVGGLILVNLFGRDGSGLLGRDEKTPLDFLEALYTAGVAAVRQEGESELAWRPVRSRSDEQGEVWYRTVFPPHELERHQDSLSRLVGRRAQPIDEATVLEGLESGKIVPVAAWTVVAAETWLLIDAYEATGRLVRLRVVPEGLRPLDVPRLHKALESRGIRQVDRIDLSAAGRLSYKEPNTFLRTLLVQLLPWLLIFGLLWFFLLRQLRSPGAAGGILSFGKARATLAGKERSLVTFADVAGIEEAKAEVREIIEFLKDPARFSRLGGRMPRGVLLVGSPGTGKTLLAKAIAGEAGVPFFSISGSDFVEMFVGVGASRVRDLFRQAREHSPCLIFLDEIDAVGRKRGAGLGGGHDEREQTLNAILVEMDGFETDQGIILVAATNRPDVLDPALLRPGRFDREIVIDLPDLRGREAILEVHARGVTMGSSVRMDVIARGTPMFSGAELAALVNEAALLATLKDKEAVEQNDLEEARDKVRWGRQKAQRVMDEEDRRITACHEAGHALVAHFHDQVEPLHKVTIIPRGMSLGATMVLPEKDRYHQRKRRLEGLISFAYGGRAAERLYGDDISAGAADDIRRATRIARMMVCEWGMSEGLGPVSYGEENRHLFLGNEIAKGRGHAEETAMEIDREVRRILESCYQDARRILQTHQTDLDRITEALMRFETLSGAQVAALVGGMPLDDLAVSDEGGDSRHGCVDEPASVSREPNSSKGDSGPARAMGGG